jgi:chemotaxis signal transduction protein
VTEATDVAAVPMLSRGVGGVVNHHGDALPVVFGRALLGCEAAASSQQASHLLVLARDLDDPDRYGLPVDRVHGLIEGSRPVAMTDDPVAERRPVEGRLMSVLDPKRLLERAIAVIECSMAEGGATQGGES